MVNLINNGDFSSSGGAPDLDPTSWSIVESAPGSVQVVAGALHFNSGSGAIGGAASQEVTGAPIGETIDFSFDYEEPGVGQGARHVHVTITDENGNVVLTQEIDDPGHYTFSLTGVTNNYTITFTDTSTGNPSNDPIIDNVVFDVPFVVCFARNSLIRCRDGLKVVQDVDAGDWVQTRDNGWQQVRWAAGSTVSGTGRMAPIRFLAGSFGNDRDLLVSPHHRMLVTGWRAELLFGEEEVLVAARDLVNDHSVQPVRMPEISYHHFLFDRHQIVESDGAWSESFFPGPFGLRALERECRAELLGLFPDLRVKAGAYGTSARRSIRPFEARYLAG